MFKIIEDHKWCNDMDEWKTVSIASDNIGKINMIPTVHRSYNVWIRWC